jgi:multidrug efflux pump subunit AcrA (membrane-fusion protein)
MAGISSMTTRLKCIVLGAAFLTACGVTAAATQSHWQGWIDFACGVLQSPTPEANADRGHNAMNDDTRPSVTLSDQSRENLGLEMAAVVLTDYWRMAMIPAQVIEESGHCEQGISASVHGVIVKIHAFLGQTVHVGDPLFDIQLTSELLATAQSSLLRTLQERELIEQEIKRLTPAVESGAIPQNRLIEKEYEHKRFDAQRLVQVQELLVRGLSPVQIDCIVTTKTLLRELTIRVPQPSAAAPQEPDGTASTIEPKDPANGEAIPVVHPHSSTFTVEEINVHLGKFVQPGDELMHLARHEQLMIEGRAFESDVAAIQRVLTEGWPVTAQFPAGEATPLERSGLSILYVDNIVNEASRSLRFFVPLKNEVVRDNQGANGLTYRTWRFKPGQAARLQLPTERLPQRIVLPADAVVREGADTYVFRANGRRLERVAVVVEHLDRHMAVLKNEGSLTPGFDVVAKNHAYQLNLELKKNHSGGGGHAGHGHDH